MSAIAVERHARRFGVLGRGRRRAGDRQLAVGCAIVVLITTLCLVIPILGGSPNALTAAPLRAPSWAHPFGTDDLGRDVFVRTWAGGRIDLLMGLLGAVVPFAVGTLVGVWSAVTERRRLGAAVMRLVDAVIAFPAIILALTLVVVLGTDFSFGPLPAGIPAVLIAIWLIAWTIFARLARAEALALADRDFITAAHLMGFSRFRIITRHMLPSVVRTTGAYAVSNSVIIIILTASLAFVGAGAQPPAPEWGAMMYEGQAVLSSAWWATLCPGIVLGLTAIGIGLAGDALIDRARRTDR